MGSSFSSHKKTSDVGNGVGEQKKVGGEGLFLGEVGVPTVTKAWGGSKASEMNSLLGRAGIAGLEKAVEVLDTLGSSISNLNLGSGFKLGAASRGNKVYILAFEVANTIAKGASLMQSLSEESIQFLKKEILVSEGVQLLVSSKNEELLGIAADDKRNEFHVFSSEVARFGDLCKNPEWHNLTRYFQKLDSDPTPQEKLREVAETTMQQLTNLMQYTSELYHEFQTLRKFEQDYSRKSQEEDSWPAHQRSDEGLMILNNELKRQRKLVQSLQKKSLWNKNMEEVVEKLVDVVVYMQKAISEAFGVSGGSKVGCLQIHSRQRLGISGLALHYANVINQIENIVSRPFSLPPNARDTLYHGLPIGVKAVLRSRIQSFQEKELSATQIKTEMQKILRWIGPMAENTTRAHRGFGWVGEWANMGSELNKKSSLPHNIKIQSLYHADKEKADEYIIRLVVWLHNLMEQMKRQEQGFKFFKPLNYSPEKTFFPSVTKLDGGQKTIWKPLLELTQEDHDMLESVYDKRLVLGRSRSYGNVTKTDKRHKRWQRSRSGGSSPVKELSSGLGFWRGKRKVLDLIDGLENPQFLYYT